jgi:hypothetical protein
MNAEATILKYASNIRVQEPRNGTYEGRLKSSWTHLITPSRYDDGLFFKVPPLANDALTTINPLLQNVLQTVDHFEICCLGASFHGWKAQKSHGGEI